MNTTESAFLEAVRDAPDDDGPRLVYADWLDEQGDPRGEFIRVQCELARLPRDDPNRGELRARSDALQAEHVRTWVRDLTPFVSAVHFRRGFVDGVTMTLSDFCSFAGQVLRSYPVTRARIEEVGPPVREELARTSPWQPALLARLAACRSLAGFRSLDLSRNGIDDSVRALARSPHLRGVRELDLSDNDIGDGGALELTASPFLDCLAALDLSSNRIGRAAVRALRARFGDRVRLDHQKWLPRWS